MATVAEPRPASLPLPGGRTDAVVRLHPLLTGTVAAPPTYLERSGTGRRAKLRDYGIRVPAEEWIRIPVPAFLVEHPSAGALMIDTGFHPAVAVDPPANLGRIGALVFKDVEMSAAEAAPAQLRARGVEPGAVGHVLMTHMHIDHASAVSEFPNAKFVLSAPEWAAANGSRPQLNGYFRRQFDHAVEFRLLDFESEAVGSFAGFGRTLDLFGDGSVRAVFTPGHSAGHVSYILRLRGREALIAGDAIYTMGTLRESALPARIHDEHTFKRSLREIQLYARETPDALIVPGHDMEHWQTLEAAY